MHKRERLVTLREASLTTALKAWPTWNLFNVKAVLASSLSAS